MKSFVFPGVIDQEILLIGAQQVPYMRTPEFSAIVKDTERMLLSFIGNNNGRTIMYTGSGTGAMDAVVCNYVKTKQKAFVIDGGSFGHRWYELCKFYQCPVIHYEVEFARDIDYFHLESQIREEKPDVLLCQHHETSSGQLFNIRTIADICKRNQVSLVVDVISSFLAEPLNMQEFGIDICITSTQKGLNVPPGLSIIFLAESLKHYQFARSSFYFDFEINLKNLQRGQTPYSPATTIFLQTHHRCQQISREGVDQVIQTVADRAKYFRSLCKANDWLIPSETPSNAITGFMINKNGDVLFNRLIKENGVYIMPGSHANFFRVSHMGIQTEKDLKDLADAIKYIEES